MDWQVSMKTSIQGGTGSKRGRGLMGGGRNAMREGVIGGGGSREDYSLNELTSLGTAAPLGSFTRNLCLLTGSRTTQFIFRPKGL